MTKQVRIRLLTSVAGDHRSLVKGDAGDELVVPASEAAKWCDGERAERILDRSTPVETTVVRPVERAAEVPPSPASTGGTRVRPARAGRGIA